MNLYYIVFMDLNSFNFYNTIASGNTELNNVEVDP